MFEQLDSRKKNLFLSLFLFCGCSSGSSSSTIYVDANLYVAHSPSMDMPGTICIIENSCRDFVARWKDTLVTLNQFTGDCRGGTVIGGKACKRSGYGCINLESSETPTGGYSMLSVHWGAKEGCLGHVDTGLNEI